VCIDVISHVCTDMDVNGGAISSGDSDISLETSPPSPQVSDRGDCPATNPRPSADIPPDPTPRPPERGRPYYDGLSLELAQAIHCWRLPRQPEYGTSARGTRTFYDTDRRWHAEGKPFISNIPLIFKFQTFEFPTITSFIYPRSSNLNFQISRTYLNSNLRISRLFHHGYLSLSILY